MTTRVVVIDDQELVRSALSVALAAVPEMAVVGTSDSVDDAVRVLTLTGPDVVLLDLRLGREHPLDRMAELLDAAPATQVLVLTGWATRHGLESALAAGARGVLSKSQRMDELVDAVRRVHRGEIVICPDLVGDLLRRATAPADASLDDRERDVLELLVEAQGTAEIAARLCLSEHTVRNRIRGLMTKLDAHSRGEAVAEALRRGLVLPAEPGPLPTG